MHAPDPLLAAARLLDFVAPPTDGLTKGRGWNDGKRRDRIGAECKFMRNEIVLGYKRADDIVASEVVADGYSQCNANGTVLMALCCRLRGFTIHKALQRGVVQGLTCPTAPAEVVRSCTEAETDSGWINLAGFVFDFGTFGSPDDFCARHWSPSTPSEAIAAAYATG